MCSNQILPPAVGRFIAAEVRQRYAVPLKVIYNFAYLRSERDSVNFAPFLYVTVGQHRYTSYRAGQLHTSGGPQNL